MISAETMSNGTLSSRPRWVNRDMNSWQTKLGSLCENWNATSLALSIKDSAEVSEPVGDAAGGGSADFAACGADDPCKLSMGCRTTEQSDFVHDNWAWRTILIDETSGNRTRNSFSRILSTAERRAPSPSRNSAREGLLEVSKTRANCAVPGFPVEAGISTVRISNSSADASAIS